LSLCQRSFVGRPQHRHLSSLPNIRDLDQDAQEHQKLLLNIRNVPSVVRQERERERERERKTERDREEGVRRGGEKTAEDGRTDPIAVIGDELQEIE
jgi:hypothetical protein